MKTNRSLEQEYKRIRETIDEMVKSRYTQMNTVAFACVLICVSLSLVFNNVLPVALRVLCILIGNLLYSNGDRHLTRERDEFLESVPSNSFIAERAFRHLEELSNIGPKFTGTYENEYLAVNYLKNEIEKIASHASTWNHVELDIQKVNGSFSTVSGETFRRQSSYQNLQNVVAKLRSSNNTAESILINCHFDTVLTSPGTGDDGLNCAVMLEVLRVLSRVDYPLKKNVVFLFNSAEEDGVEIYAKSVPYPNGKVIGEELFGTGLLPGGTDFRIFQHYGNLSGLDFAHVRNGYVYHTSNDNISMVSQNDCQVTGDNLLSLTKALVDYDNLQEAIQRSKDSVVYFDVFGKFVVCYSSKVGLLVNLVVVVISLYSAVTMLRSVFRGRLVSVILYHVLIDTAFLVSGVVAVTPVLYLLAWLLKQCNGRMLWFSYQWFVLTYYAVPALLVMFTAVRLRRDLFRTSLNVEQEAKVFIFVAQIIITIIFSLGTASGIRSSFILGIGLIGVSISHYFMNKTRLRLEIVEHKFLTYVVVNFIPALYCAYVFIPSFEIIIPMMGRVGSEFDSEIAILIMTEIAVLLTFAYFIPLVVLVKEFWTMQYLFFIVYILHVFYVLSASLVPFSGLTPQRFVALHVNRKLAYLGDNENKSETSGYLISTSDILGGKNFLMLFEHEGFKKLGDIEDTCKTELFCGMPTYNPKRINVGHLSFWAPKEKPILPRGKQMKHRIGQISTDLIQYDITLKGSKFMDVVILPTHDVTLHEWSFHPSVPSDELKWNDQPAYFIRYHEGSLDQIEWSFKLTFNVSEMRSDDINVFKLAWSVYHPESTAKQWTLEFKEFIGEFPEWTRVVPLVVEYEEYIFNNFNQTDNSERTL